MDCDKYVTVGHTRDGWLIAAVLWNYYPNLQEVEELYATRWPVSLNNSNFTIYETYKAHEGV